MQFTTDRLEAPNPRSSRTQGSFLSRGNTSRRYYRTVSRRTEPSSCGILMDEQPNPWPLLHDQDIPSRQRCTKPRGRFIQFLSLSFLLCCIRNSSEFLNWTKSYKYLLYFKKHNKILHGFARFGKTRLTDIIRS